MSLEGYPDEYVEIDNVIPGYGRESTQSHGKRQGRSLQSAADAVVVRHYGIVNKTTSTKDNPVNGRNGIKQDAFQEDKRYGYGTGARSFGSAVLGESKVGEKWNLHIALQH